MWLSARVPVRQPETGTRVMYESLCQWGERGYSVGC